jgi:hypothetical protein
VRANPHETVTKKSQVFYTSFKNVDISTYFTMDFFDSTIRKDVDIWCAHRAGGVCTPGDRPLSVTDLSLSARTPPVSL